MARAQRVWQTMLLTAGVLAILNTQADAAKEAYTRTKPHVNVGSVGGIPAMIWFHASAVVFDDGDAAGIVQLRIEDGDTLLYRVTSGTVDVAAGIVREMVLLLERVGGGEVYRGESDVLILRLGTEDELIYDLLGADIHGQVEGVLDFALHFVPLP
jgi:hypothetical protein